MAPCCGVCKGKPKSFGPVGMVDVALFRKFEPRSIVRAYRHAVVRLPYPVPSGLHLCTPCSIAAHEWTEGELVPPGTAAATSSVCSKWLRTVERPSSEQRKLLDVLPPGAVIRRTGMAGLIFVGDLDSMVLCKGCREGALHTAALHDLAPPAQAAPEGRKPTVAGSVGPGPADVVKRALREVDVIIEEQSEVVLDGGDGNRRTMPLNAIAESAREGEIGPRQGREAQVCQVLTRVVDRVTAMVKSKDSSSS